MPRIFGVQAEGSAAMANAFRAGSGDDHPGRAPTPWPTASRWICRGMACARCAPRARPAGAYLTVSDAEILQAIAALGTGGDLCRTGRGDGLCRAGQGAASRA